MLARQAVGHVGEFGAGKPGPDQRAQALQEGPGQGRLHLGRRDRFGREPFIAQRRLQNRPGGERGEAVRERLGNQGVNGVWHGSENLGEEGEGAHFPAIIG